MVREFFGMFCIGSVFGAAAVIAVGSLFRASKDASPSPRKWIEPDGLRDDWWKKEDAPPWATEEDWE